MLRSKRFVSPAGGIGEHADWIRERADRIGCHADRIKRHADGITEHGDRIKRRADWIGEHEERIREHAGRIRNDADRIVSRASSLILRAGPLMSCARRLMCQKPQLRFRRTLISPPEVCRESKSLVALAVAAVLAGSADAGGQEPYDHGAHDHTLGRRGKVTLPVRRDR